MTSTILIVVSAKAAPAEMARPAAAASNIFIVFMSLTPIV